MHTTPTTPKKTRAKKDPRPQYSPSEIVAMGERHLKGLSAADEEKFSSVLHALISNHPPLQAELGVYQRAGAHEDLLRQFVSDLLFGKRGSSSIVFKVAFRGDPPAFWFGQAMPGSREPDVEGDKLLALARKVLEIPIPPEGTAPIEPASASSRAAFRERALAGGAITMGECGCVIKYAAGVEDPHRAGATCDVCGKTIVWAVDEMREALAPPAGKPDSPGEAPPARPSVKAARRAKGKLEIPPTQASPAATPEPRAAERWAAERYRTDRGAQSIDVARIEESPTNARKRFDETQLAELAASIKAHGVLQNLVVRPAGKGYVLIAGARRLRAAKQAGLLEVPCRVIDADDATADLLELPEEWKRRSFLKKSRPPTRGSWCRTPPIPRWESLAALDPAGVLRAATKAVALWIQHTCESFRTDNQPEVLAAMAEMLDVDLAKSWKVTEDFLERRPRWIDCIACP